MEKSLLDLYIDYLISSFRPTTAMGLGRLVEGEISSGCCGLASRSAGTP